MKLKTCLTTTALPTLAMASCRSTARLPTALIRLATKAAANIRRASTLLSNYRHCCWELFFIYTYIYILIFNFFHFIPSKQLTKTKRIISYSDVTVGRVIGAGQFGVVHAGTYEDNRVAIKLLVKLFKKHTKNCFLFTLNAKKHQTNTRIHTKHTAFIARSRCRRRDERFVARVGYFVGIAPSTHCFVLWRHYWRVARWFGHWIDGCVCLGCNA